MAQHSTDELQEDVTETTDLTVTGTVLIVDDDASNLRLLDTILSAEFDTVVADSGEQALKVLKSQQVDLILLDLMMPGMDGIAVCREVRS